MKMNVVPQLKNPLPTLVEARKAVEDGIIETDWTESTWKKRRGALGTIVKVYKQLAPDIAPEDILCDPYQLKALVQPFIDIKEIPSRCGFKNYEAFYACQSNAMGFFKFASGLSGQLKSLSMKKDGFSRLRTAMASANDGKPVCASHEMIPFDTLSRICRLNDIDINDLTTEKLIEIIEAVPTKYARHLLKAAVLLDSVQTEGQIAKDLLPPDFIGDLSKRIVLDKRKTAQLHWEYEEKVCTYIKRLRAGTIKCRLGGTKKHLPTHNGIGEKRAKMVRQELTWLHDGLVAAGIVSYDQPFPWNKVFDPEYLKIISDLDAQGKLSRNTQPKTRKRRIRSAVAFLETLSPGYSQGIEKEFYQYSVLNNEKHFTSPRQIWKKQATIDFVNCQDKQKIFYGMPALFYHQAKDLIENWDEIGKRKGISTQQGRALDLAIIAVFLTITTRFPLRTATLLNLRWAGITPHLRIPSESSETASVLPTSDIIKNNHSFASGVKLLPSTSHNPTEMLNWYLDFVHPLILKYKVHSKTRKPDLLFAGVSYDAIARKFYQLTEEAGLPMTPHMVRHFAGSILFSRQIPINKISQLLGITERSVRRNYVYIDQQKQVQDCVDDIAMIYKEVEK
jgi:hypothetical protein